MPAGPQLTVEEICLHALELDEPSRPGYLADVCGDEATRREVESLLANATFADGLLESPASLLKPAAGATKEPDSPGPGTEIGPYRLLEKLGEGGMGVVYRAVQEKPVRREVALKLIRPGWDAGLVAARFAAERQALALMEHANIARVLDAGTTAGERSWFAMELVQGKPITSYSEEAGLTVRQRVELMIPVCQAIQHAHQKGIIHRDIKPSNILVAQDDDVAIPKVIDFGIAKATEGPLHEGATFTRAFDILGTFAYMSPEQAEPGVRDIDVRADVYSLGAVLYELMAGAPPLGALSLREMSYAAILKRIQEESPPPPSARGGGVTAAQLRGECDWIALKALEKDRERRFESAGAMARDLQRYLSGDPVEAGPPSKLYRARKFAARHRWALGAAVAFVAALLAAIVGMFIALRQQVRANRDDAALREVVRKIIIERPGQLAQVPNRTALRGELMRDAEGALDVLSREVRGDDALALEIANAWLAIGLARGPYSAQGSEGDPAAAASYVHKAIDLYSNLASRRPSDPDVRRGQLEALSTWLHLQYRLGALEPGKDAGRRLENVIAALPADVRDKVQANWYLSTAYLELGSILWNADQTKEALDLHRKALATLGVAAAPASWTQDPERLEQWSHLRRELAISSWMYEGPGPEAESAARQSVDVLSGCSAPVCRMRRAQAGGTLGEIEWGVGKHEQGISTLRQSLADFEALSREDPANAVYAYAGGQVRAYLALLLGKSGVTAEAVALADRNLRLPSGADGNLQKGRERRMVYRVTLGATLLEAGHLDDAVREMRDTLRQNSDWNANYDLRWSALHILARALEAQGKFDQALTAARDARRFVVEQGGAGYRFQVCLAISARDFAAAAARAKTATPADRAAALAAVAEGGHLDPRYATLTGALLEAPPPASEMDELRQRLRQ
jgi:serine/threonine protein kinase